jgi:hypothetical protein
MVADQSYAYDGGYCNHLPFSSDAAHTAYNETAMTLMHWRAEDKQTKVFTSAVHPHHVLLQHLSPKHLNTDKREFDH